MAGGEGGVCGGESGGQPSSAGEGGKGVAGSWEVLAGSGGSQHYSLGGLGAIFIPTTSSPHPLGGNAVL